MSLRDRVLFYLVLSSTLFWLTQGGPPSPGTYS